MVIDLLKKLISIESSTKEGANKAVDFCETWLLEHNLSVRKLENNGYKMLLCEIGKGDFTLVLNGHVDVVSGHPQQFIPFEKDGKLFGRGSADMKAGVAAMMCALLNLKDQELGVKIQLQIVSDEEIGGLNCSRYLAENGYRGDFVICSEPTQLGIAHQAKGVLRLDFKISGKSAHGSRPWEGINAIEKAYRVYEQILELPFAKESTSYYASPSINLAKIQAGDVYNKVPDECLMCFDLRFLPTQNKEEIMKEIESVTDGNVYINMFAEPINTDKNHPVISLLDQIVEANTKTTTLFFGQHGTADTVFFAKYGIPAIEFGPSGDNWHGDEEYVDIESVQLYQNMLVEFVKKLGCSS
ncbi:M20 family metallopeptidase [Neobacillus ginsengisoli]|uniref:Succinyl-diaminopimelate desuccinylase n=1 Tax=Neobacillus ginsengisoli TaxID=904295 RepID=A0ABT9XYX4_9BACI|nr:M20/M25/M40 family metallo-hydrolase [Neobacillus ginsengisoli]MDQ0200681.1 succinyl-diaminopimelate desuccinylase [Neobacillus ginsengisoli]